jgi:hypothetical protein
MRPFDKLLSRREFLQYSATGGFATALAKVFPAIGADRAPQKEQNKTILPFNPGLHFLAIGDTPDHIEQMMGGRDSNGTFELVKKLGHIPIITDVTNRDSHPAQLKNLAALVSGVKPDHV